jgi:hypothetical protein
MKRRGVYWVTLGPSPWFATCQRCGKHEMGPKLPISITGFGLFTKYLMELHRGCREPKAAEAPHP